MTEQIKTQKNHFFSSVFLVFVTRGGECHIAGATAYVCVSQFDRSGGLARGRERERGPDTHTHRNRRCIHFPFFSIAPAISILLRLSEKEKETHTHTHVTPVNITVRGSQHRGVHFTLATLARLVQHKKRLTPPHSTLTV